MSVVTFNNVEDMLQHIQQSRARADVRIQPWQKSIEPPAKVIRLAEAGPNVLVIYGELIDPVKAEQSMYDLNDPIQAAEYDYTVKHYTGDWKRSYRFGRFFSVDCPKGELGDIHLSTIVAVITEAEFLFAQKHGWPSDMASVYRAALRRKAS